MDSRIPNRVTIAIAAIGALIAGIAFLVVGGQIAVATLIGALVAVVNWLALRWLLRRVQSGETRGKAGVMVLLALKMGALMAICYVLVVRFDVHPLGFVIGLAALPAGIVVGGSRGAPAANEKEG
jgi:peptidoglycan biosynthesis protein MviN/MurJ (putative lipid II flippase)